MPPLGGHAEVEYGVETDDDYPGYVDQAITGASQTWGWEQDPSQGQCWESPTHRWSLKPREWMELSKRTCSFWEQRVQAEALRTTSIEEGTLGNDRNPLRHSQGEGQGEGGRCWHPARISALTPRGEGC